MTGTTISSSVFNALTADLATGLSTCITKDGQTATTARIPFASGISSTLTTNATSITTGSIITDGGISTQKALWVGGLANIAGVLTTQAAIVNDSTTDSTAITNGAIQTDGGLGVTKALWVGGLANIAGAATLQSTLAVTGATTLTGALTYGGVTLSNAVTGTGNMVLATSPTFTTSVIGGATMSVFNSASTTVNAFGAASTALNIGHASGTNTVLGATNFSQTVTLIAPVLGTPASGNLVNATGYVGTSSLVTVGALNSGSITSGFGAIDVGADAISGGAATFTAGTFSGAVNIAGVAVLLGGSSLGLTIRSNGIQTEEFNGVDGIVINYAGYLNGTTQFRNFNVYNGKQAQVFSIVGATGAVTIPGTLAVTGAVSGAAATFTTGTFSSTIQSGGDAVIRNANAADVTLTLGSTPSDNWSSRINLLSSTTQINWQISTNTSPSGSGGFAITPSTAGGGSTFTTAALAISSAGAVTIPGTLAVTGAVTSSGQIKGASVVGNFATDTTVGDWTHSRIAIYNNGSANNLSQQAYGFFAGTYAPASFGLITTSGAGNTKGDFTWYTRDVTTDTAPTEKLRLSSAGALIATDQANTSAFKFNSFVSNSVEAGNIIRVAQTAAVTFTATSDYRVKETFGPLLNASDLLRKLKVYDGAFNHDTTRRPLMLAHEIQTITPWNVYGDKDAVNADGSMKLQTVSLAGQENLLVAGWQDLDTRLAAIEKQLLINSTKDHAPTLAEYQASFEKKAAKDRVVMDKMDAARIAKDAAEKAQREKEAAERNTEEAQQPTKEQ